MHLAFTKMHGLGNDFVVIDATGTPIELSTEQVRMLADRRFGVGCDQVLLVEAPHRGDADFHYRIFNADGGEVEQCGNGARCFARFVRDRGLTDKDVIRVDTRSGRLELVLLPDGQVTVDMGRPRFAPEDIPFHTEQQASRYTLEAGGQLLEIGAVSMGNPHAVLRVNDVGEAPLESLGPIIEHHTCFPERVNVGFMQIVNRGHIRLRVFERGAGETLACGSGACAAVAVGRQQGLLDAKVSVELAGGMLLIEWDGGEGSVLMTGPASHVFEGQIDL